MATKNTVALLSFPTTLGRTLLIPLAKAHDEGKFTLILLHGADEDSGGTPRGVEKRVLSHLDSDPGHIREALKGVDILISAVDDQVSDNLNPDFLTSLAEIKTLTTYIPSDFSVNWSAEELKVEDNVGARAKDEANKKAKKLGVPLTEIHGGVPAYLFLDQRVVGVDLRNNKLSLYGDALSRKLPVTTTHYLGQALAQLVAGPKDKLPGTRYTIVENSWTGKEVQDALEKSNGAKPEVSKVTEDELKATLRGGRLYALGSELKKKWGAGEFPNNDPYNPKGVDAISLDQLFTGQKDAWAEEGWDD